MGYSLVELVVSLSIGLLVTTSAFRFLEGGRAALAREPEVVELNANLRAALDRVSADLTVAGVGAPSEMAVLWHEGAESADGITILYSDAESPIARPRPCEGVCDPIRGSSQLILDPGTMSPVPADYETAYAPGTILFALESALAGPECAAARPALIWFQLTDSPRCSGESGERSGAERCGALILTHGPVRNLSGADLPEGFGSEVDPACAFVGSFHAIQYRVSSRALERRDLFHGEDWSPVATGIEDFQLQYMQGFEGLFEDAPSAFPSAFSPGTWLTAVRITVASASGDDPLLARTLSTTVSLRNQLGQASLAPTVGWN